MSNILYGGRQRVVGSSVGVFLAVACLMGSTACTGVAGPGSTTTSSPNASATESGKPDSPPNSDPPSVEAYGEVPPGFASWTEVLELQAHMTYAADKISAAAGAESALAGIVAAPENRRLIVYWKGEPPGETLQLIDQIRAHLPIDVLSAQYSASELTAVSASVINQPGVVSVGGNVDGSGVTATVDADVNPADWGVDVPVTLKPGQRPVPLANLLCSRWDDCSPYWGGAADWGCSLGFAVQKGGTRYMLSAGHCGDPGKIVMEPNGETIGSVYDDDVATDSMLIQHMPNGDFAGRIYTGSWDSNVFHHKPVQGTHGSYVGNYICNSGAYSDEHCGLKVDWTNQVVRLVDGLAYPISSATNYYGGIAAGGGDSGGPLHTGYTLIPNPDDPFWPKVSYTGTLALGIGSAGDIQRTCPLVVKSGVCYQRVYYADVRYVLKHYQATIVTSAT